MPRRIIEHIHNHPRRLAATLGALLLVSLGMLGWSLTVSLDAAHQGRLENCRAVNELSRKIFVSFADMGVPLSERIKFLPTDSCKDLP